MYRYYLFVITTMAVVGRLSGQDVERRADLGRGAGPGGAEGCNVVVIVDGVADVEIRGDRALLHNISGQAPQLRVFECSRPVPPNAPGLRFIAESGRGRQELLSRPGGPVVVHIQDSNGGAGEYRFHLAWNGPGGPPPPPERMDRDRGGDDRYFQDRDRFFQGQGWRRNLFQRVREDVEHLQQATIPFTGDRARLTRTIGQLNELQGKLSQGRYDERELGDVINALRAVVEENRMSPRDRDILTDDLNRLRDFRERHDDYGAKRPRN